MAPRKVEKVLVSQPEPANGKSPYYDIGDKYNVEFVFKPFFKIERVSIKEFRQQKVDILEHTGVVFTSRASIDHFFSIAEEMKTPIPESMKYFCLSEAIALYLQKYIVYRKRRIFFSETGQVEGLDAALTKHSKELLLYPVAEEHNDKVCNFLNEKEIKYTKSVMYRTVSNDFKEGLNADMVLFFSPQGVSSLMKNFPNFEQGDMAIGCFGLSTAKALEDGGLRVDCLAPQPEYPSMTMAIEAFLEKNHKAHK